MSTDLASQRIQKQFTIHEPVTNASDWLMQSTGLSKGRIKSAMTCGAVQVKKPKSKWQRLRRATAGLPKGTEIKLNYDPTLLAIKPQVPELIEDCVRYSVWFKAPGILSQGNEWGDHCSILRLVELHFANQRKVFLG